MSTTRDATPADPDPVAPSIDPPEIESAETSTHEPVVTEPVIPEPTASEPTSPEATTVVIEAEDAAVLDTDSAFGDNVSDEDSKRSLSSGIRKYRNENGRTYHAFRDGQYLMPNDDEEQERLDLQHHLFNLLAGGKLNYAPIDKPDRVLDIGTGTGIWAMDFADQNPSSHVIGSDLSPIQPGWVPPNLEFEVDDVESPWLHKPFNYIHVRTLGGSLKSYRNMLASAFENLAPGGWCETVEFECWVRDQKADPADYTKAQELECAPMIQKWQAGLSEAGIKIGRRFDVAFELKKWMLELGFVNVVEQVVKVPLAPWPKERKWKEIGMYQQQNMLDGTGSYGSAHFTRVLGWSMDEYTVLSAGCRNELKDSHLQLTSDLYVVYGQKPATET